MKIITAVKLKLEAYFSTISAIGSVTQKILEIMFKGVLVNQ
jgi:hypothetical protein